MVTFEEFLKNYDTNREQVSDNYFFVSDLDLDDVVSSNLPVLPMCDKAVFTMGRVNVAFEKYRESGDRFKDITSMLSEPKTLCSVNKRKECSDDEYRNVFKCLLEYCVDNNVNAVVYSSSGLVFLENL